MKKVELNFKDYTSENMGVIKIEGKEVKIVPIKWAVDRTSKCGNKTISVSRYGSITIVHKDISTIIDHDDAMMVKEIQKELYGGEETGEAKELELD